MNRRYLLLILWLLGVVLFVYTLFANRQSTVSINGVNVVVELAVKEDEQSKGLSGREKLGENQGMLFVYQDDRSDLNFWMKEMNFPIDIIWINSENKVVDVDPEVSPSSYPELFSPDAPAKYVLEVNAGFAQSSNIVIGSEVILSLL